MKGITKSLEKKEKNDKFYTKPEIAAWLLQEIHLSSYSLVIEPFAGNGSFSNQIINCVALDIEPESSNIQKQDFFNLLFAASSINSCDRQSSVWRTIIVSN